MCTGGYLLVRPFFCGINDFDNKMLNTILTGFALVLVIEGMMPFMSPRAWKQMVATIMQMSDRSLRIAGFISMIAGVGLLYWVNA